MTRNAEVIRHLLLLKECAVKSHNDTGIIDVKIDSFNFVIDMAIQALEQEPKTGHWIYDDDVLSYEGHFGAYTCSCCNKTFLDDLCMNNGSDEINVENEFKYCPFCGAKMESEG